MPQNPIAKLLQRRTWHVLGVNTGTSVDGIDMALIEISSDGGRRRIRLRQTKSYPFPPRLREKLHRLASADHVSKEEVARTHYHLGATIADCINRFRHTLPHPGRIDLLGSHGQTIGHFPRSAKLRTDPRSATWQIGSPAVIAHRTGIVTIADFRAGDIAAGGMGAPLSGYYHYLMFGAGHVVLNLGGIANISAARGRGRNLEILAFDVGPGNMVIDAIASRVLKKPVDRNGKLAASGTPDARILSRARRHPYFRRRPPKTCGREEFGVAAIESWLGRTPMRVSDAPDLLATAVAITADAVSDAVHRWVQRFTPRRSMIVTGGGTRNRTLMTALEARLPEWTVTSSADIGIPAQYVEPVGFAVLAFETLHARPGNRGGATGGLPTVLGSIALP